MWEGERAEGGRVRRGPYPRAGRWDGTKRLGRGPFDWPGPSPGFPRPARAQGSAPGQTRELAALSACRRASTSVD